MNTTRPTNHSRQKSALSISHAGRLAGLADGGFVHEGTFLGRLSLPISAVGRAVRQRYCRHVRLVDHTRVEERMDA